MKRKNKKYHNGFGDYFTMGHFFKGLVIFFIMYVILLKFGFENGTAVNTAFGSVIILALSWEFIENCLLNNIKIHKTKDSLENSLTDIVFDILGGLTGLLSILIINIIFV